jgi:hypothetical protein
MSSLNNTDDSPKEDFLKVDKPIPGQNFVCLSFISPEDVIEKKELFMFHCYLRSKYKDERDLEAFKTEYDMFLNNNKDKLEDKFKEVSDFRTSIRGLKVRGIYDTKREADVRAKVLQRLDKSFHVYVAQVGYWLPWNPNVDEIDAEYDEAQLNELVGNYEDNQRKKDAFYEKETEERKRACVEENRATSAMAEDTDADTSSTTQVQLQQQTTVELSKPIDNNGLMSGGSSSSMSVENILDAINSTDDHNTMKSQFENMNITE